MTRCWEHTPPPALALRRLSSIVAAGLRVEVRPRGEESAPSGRLDPEATRAMAAFFDQMNGR